MMRESSSGLTQRAGYPRQPQTFLDVPTGEEDDLAVVHTAIHLPIRKGGRTEPWLIRKIEAFSKASFYTKATYAWLFTSLTIAWLGFRGIRHGHASVWLTCTSQSCELEITPPGPPKVTRITILREQLIRADAVKVDSEGTVVRVLDGAETTGAMPHQYHNHAGNKKKKGKKKNPRYDIGDKGPDEDGNFDSYVLVVSEHGPDKSEDVDIENQDSKDDDSSGEEEKTKEKKWKPPKSKRHPTNSLEPLNQIVQPNEDGEYVFHMRRFNLGQSRRKALSTVTRINSFIRNRRHKIAIRETRHVAWQAIVAIVLGLFSLILSLLCGQFFEPEPARHRVAGPGMRADGGRSSRPRRAPPAAAGLHGCSSSTAGRQSTTTASRPSRPNSGYGSYGGYRPSAPQKRSY